jgi:ribonucleotide reductase alpha subunit
MIEAEAKTTERRVITITKAPYRSIEVPSVIVDDARDVLLTAFGKATLKERYLTENESFQDRFANAMRYYADDQAHAQRMYDYVSKLWCMGATPIMSNGGTTKGNLISCFVNDAEDSLEGIVNTWTENIWIAAKGGGVGTYWGKVRGIGAKIARNGKSSGMFSFVKVQDSLTACINQGSNRRGAGAIYVPMNHPEIETVLDMRRQAGGDPDRKAMNLNHGVVVDDEFMHAVRSGSTYKLICPHTGEVTKEVDARHLVEKLLICRLETGEPYILFKDTINRALPEHHKQSKLEVKTSNLCVAPETRILTRNGYVEIQDVAGTEQEVWNGKKWSRANVAKTGENQKLVSVVFSNDVKLDVTEYHKFKIIKNGESVEVRTHELIPGDTLITYDIPDEGGELLVQVKNITVVDIVDNGRIDDTYCFNEPEEHMGVFEGILTGNCSEIVLPTGKDHHGRDRTAVCCLFQLNLDKYGEWCDNEEFIEDVLRFLDNVLQDFIDNAGDHFKNSRYSAMMERSVGMGVMGFHSFLQAKNVAFSSVMAKAWNTKIFTNISEKAKKASRKLAEERGACPDAAEYEIMERFSYKTAIAPTATSSIICGEASPSIDPITANIYTHKTMDGSFEVKNPRLEKLLEARGQNTRAVWNSILENDGSVQHLDFLTDHEKKVYETAFEIDPRCIIDLAADRAPMIDQAQSVNIWLRPDCEKHTLWKLMEMAWERGVKSLYYQRSISILKVAEAKGEKINTVTPVQKYDFTECLSCQ